MKFYPCNVEGMVAFSSGMETVVDSSSHPRAITQGLMASGKQFSNIVHDTGLEIQCH